MLAEVSEPLWLEMNSIDNTTITSRIRTLPLLTGYSQDYVLVLCMAGFRTLIQFFESGPDCLAETTDGSAMYISVTCVHVNTQL